MKPDEALNLLALCPINKWFFRRDVEPAANSCPVSIRWMLHLHVKPTKSDDWPHFWPYGIHSVGGGESDCNTSREGEAADDSWRLWTWTAGVQTGLHSIFLLCFHDVASCANHLEMKGLFIPAEELRMFPIIILDGPLAEWAADQCAGEENDHFLHPESFTLMDSDKCERASSFH